MSKDNNLIWIDMEMTGLDPSKDRILEIAIIITDSKLDIISEAPVMVIHQDEKRLSSMDSWNTAMHNKTGLVDKVKISKFTEKIAEKELLNYLKQYVNKKASPMCGNSICQDRRFLAESMPKLEDYFHYRNLDVSTIKELAKRWKPQLLNNFKKQGKHEALADVKESINELIFYRKNFINF